MIADKAGKEQLTQVLARREPVEAEAAPEEPATQAAPAPTTFRLPPMAWVGLVAVLLISAIIFMLFQMRW